jgi:hypothetical protein
MTYANLISEIQNLSYEDKESLKKILEKYLIEERREEIYENLVESKKEMKEGKLKYSNDINELKKMLR